MDLYDEIGGREAITAMVDVFYKKVVVDGRVSRWFEGIDMTRQRGKMVNFLTCVTKGKPYERDLTIPHAKMVDAGLDDEAFDVIEELMTTAMKVRIVIAWKVQNLRARTAFSKQLSFQPYLLWLRIIRVAAGCSQVYDCQIPST